ncbi:TlpA family protein disulfide reductase [Thalassoroseus pseudoceratinae]|uniref:TlpA family protein disulfide reductase n=1 Tax=Thalassoroseus pseudoceratinae TaxID=2713176 RepID=UPI001423014E|nr:TlpA disulfide reductase family protein [Thalassoroseus pseudoceratinae]
MRLRPTLITSIAFAFALWLTLPLSQAQQDSKDTAKKDTAKKDTAKEEKAESSEKKFVVPDGSDLEELKAFIKEVQQTRPTTVEELVEMQSALDEAATKLLNAKDLPVAEAGAAFEVRMQALTWKGRFGDKEALGARQALAEKYKTDKRPLIAQLANNYLLQIRIQSVGELSEKERDELIDDVLASAEKDGLTRENFRPAYTLAQTLERSGATKAAIDVYNRLAKIAKSSDDEDIAGFAGTLEGTARRLGLMGDTMKLVGKTVDDKPFDWDSYRGKVVLVDFWATWCGPCLAEIPNMMKNYEAYHEKGFDIVGINQDDNQLAVQKFLTEQELPWTTVWAEGQPNAEFYGINAIPQMILVDKEGKVVALNLRGPQLGEKLREMLGEPAPVKEKDEDKAAE